MKAYIGIDASVNSTGLVIRIPELNKLHFIKIVADYEKKCSGSIKQVKYDRFNPGENYSSEDVSKIVSSMRVAKTIGELVVKHDCGCNEFEFTMEANIMPRRISSSHNDLVANNSVIKAFIIAKYGVKAINIVAPSQLKLSYTGSAATKKKIGGKMVKIDSKAAMLSAFKKEFPGFDYTGKIDDVIDAYGLSKYVENMNFQLAERKRLNEEAKASKKLAKEEAKRKKAGLPSLQYLNSIDYIVKQEEQAVKLMVESTTNL